MPDCSLYNNIIMELTLNEIFTFEVSLEVETVGTDAKSSGTAVSNTMYNYTS